jgi:hypothetical protein
VAALVAAAAVSPNAAFVVAAALDAHPASKPTESASAKRIAVNLFITFPPLILVQKLYFLCK